MIARIERAIAHKLGMHTIGCRGRLACAPRPGQEMADVRFRRLGWHRWSSGGAR